MSPAQIRAMRGVTSLLALLHLREPVLAARKAAARRRRRRAEARGDDRLSRPALHELDRKLDAIINLDGGFFVEAGGNDGFTQSNTYWLERFRGWRGMLVEPMPELAAEARLERPGTPVIQAALVAPDHDGATVRMVFGDLMTTVAGTHDGDEAGWTSAGLALGWRDPREEDVPARTLSDILDEVGAPEIDLLSLDVEGYEATALRGLDLDRHAPRFLVIEMHDIDVMRSEIEEVLGDGYVFGERLSPVDVLYVRADVAASTASYASASRPAIASTE